jgi:hypothetical protein
LAAHPEVSPLAGCGRRGERAAGSPGAGDAASRTCRPSRGGLAYPACGVCCGDRTSGAQARACALGFQKRAWNGDLGLVKGWDEIDQATLGAWGRAWMGLDKAALERGGMGVSLRLVCGSWACSGIPPPSHSC